MQRGMEPVAAAFERVTAGGEPLALVVLRDGELLLDLSAGVDGAGRPFSSSTPVFLYSAVKPMAALAVLVAAAEGEMDLDAPVARTWPAFGEHGKDRITVREALAHGAAVPGWRAEMTLASLDDRLHAAEELAAAEPWWAPGEPGEHAVSYGHLLDGMLRHATGRDIAQWWERALRVSGCGITLRPGSGALAPAVLEDPGGAWRREWRSAPGLMGELLRNPGELLDVEVVNGPAGRSLVAPAVTGYGSARDLAALWAWWTGERPDPSLGALRLEALRPQVTGHDHVLDREVAWGLGPQVGDGEPGMGGVGGCVGWIQDGMGVGLTTPRVGPFERFDPIDEAFTRIA